jgi:hypothetical protein
VIGCKNEPEAVFAERLARVTTTAEQSLHAANGKKRRTAAYWNAACSYTDELEKSCKVQFGLNAMYSGNARAIATALQRLPTNGVDEDAARAVLTTAATLVRFADFAELGAGKAGAQSAAEGATVASGSPGAQGAALAGSISSGIKGGLSIRELLSRTDAEAAIARGVLVARYDIELRSLRISYN